MTHPFDLPPAEYDKLAGVSENDKLEATHELQSAAWALEMDYDNWRKDSIIANQPVIECSRCIAPGNCCKAINISLRIPSEIVSPHGAAKYLSEKGMGFHGLHPFVAIRPAEYPSPGGSRTWLWSCTALRPDGRCGMYEDRPDLCRVYEPGSDGLCVHVRGPDGHPIVPQKPKE